MGPGQAAGPLRYCNSYGSEPVSVEAASCFDSGSPGSLEQAGLAEAPEEIAVQPAGHEVFIMLPLDTVGGGRAGGARGGCASLPVIPSSALPSSPQRWLTALRGSPSSRPRGCGGLLGGEAAGAGAGVLDPIIQRARAFPRMPTNSPPPPPPPPPPRSGNPPPE